MNSFERKRDLSLIQQFGGGLKSNELVRLEVFEDADKNCPLPEMAHLNLNMSP